MTRRSYPAVLVYLSLELGLNITWQVATESLWHRQKYKIQHTICRGWRGGRGGRYTCPSIEPIQIKACFGGVQLHGTHLLGHFSGRVWCYTCVCSFAVTGPRVPPSLLGPCTGHMTEDTAKRNVHCLAKGELPAAWRAGGWPLGPEAGLLHFAV